MTQLLVRSATCTAVVVGLAVSALSLPAAETKADRLRQQLLKLHNEERKAAGLELLTINAELTKAAQDYAKFLTTSEELSHTASGTPRTRVKEAGYKPTAVGENLASGQTTAAEVMKNWMESKTHKENILRENFTEVGFGLATNDKGQIIWVVDFGRP